MGNLDRQALYEAKKKNSVIPLSNNVWLNLDLVKNDTTNKVFKSYQDAVTWINANGGTLSDSNTWTIKLPSGLITEVITKYQFIELQASIGTVINELKSDIDYTIPGALLYCIVNNFKINKITLENGKAINLSNCVVYDIECDTDGYFNALHSYILGNCDFDNISTVEFRNTYIGTNLTIDNLGNASFSDCNVKTTITVEDGQIVTFVNSFVIEAAIESGGSIDNFSTYVDSLTNNGTYKVLNKLTNSDVSPIEDNAGCTRYIETANSSSFEMVMQTGASTWEWVVIKQNTW